VREFQSIEEHEMEKELKLKGKEYCYFSDTISLNIPKFTTTGTVIKIPKKGHEGKKNAGGDAIIVISVAPHSKYKYMWLVDGKESEKPESQGDYPNFVEQHEAITVSQAVLGTRMLIETVYGEQILIIPRGTNHGDSVIIEPPKLKGYRERCLVMNYAEYEEKEKDYFTSMHSTTEMLKGGKYLPPTVVKIAIKLPESLSEEQRKILEQIQNTQMI
jgi:DnaJ-class molecular chaperone